MAKVKTMKLPKQVPLWLRRLSLVKAEMKGVRFPRNAEEGFQQMAELSATNLRILREQVRSELPRPSEREVEIATRRLLARLSHAEAEWTRVWKRERARGLGR